MVYHLDEDNEFESLVNSVGYQTRSDTVMHRSMFESLVNSVGYQT